MKEKLSEYAGRINDYADKISEKYADDTIQRKSIKMSLFGTVIVWFVILVFMAVSPLFNRQKKYKEIRITLAPVPVEKTAVEKPVSTTPVKRTEQKKAAEQKAAASAPAKPKAAPKAEQKNTTQPAKTAASEQPKKASYTIKKDTQAAFNEQVNTNTKKTNWDDVNWSEQTENKSTSSSQSTQNNQKSLDSSKALSGSAGTVDKSDGKAVSKAVDGTSSNTKASSETKNALSDVANVKPFSMSGNGFASKADVKVSSTGDGSYKMAMNDGSARVLVYPSKPYIEISDENGKLIDSTRNVKISLTILKDGSVPLTGISFRPESVLPEAIKKEIREQIDDWRFSQASSESTATFDYSIIKR